MYITCNGIIIHKFDDNCTITEVKEKLAKFQSAYAEDL